MRAYLTGAEADGLGQYDHAASLGGFRSSARVSCMTSKRVTAFPGISVQAVEGANGVGVGRLIARDENTLRWAAPGEDFGDAVRIANGETKVLSSATASKCITIRRKSDLAFAGLENIQIGDTYNNLIGMSNFSEAESTAGAAKYRAVILKNVGVSNITNLKVWVDGTLDTRIAVAAETPTSGEIQTVADEDTAPTAVTFSAPTSGSPLTIGTLTPGQTVGLWVKRYVDAGASADARVTANVIVQFDFASVTYVKHLRGAGRIAQAGIAGTLAYWGAGADPDWLTASPDEVVTSFPQALTLPLTAGVWYLRERKRNAYGIIGPPLEPVKVFRVADDLSESEKVPTGPSVVQVRAWGEGGYRVDAQYVPDWDEIGFRANQWLIYATTDGTDPDPATDTPVVENMTYDVLSVGIGRVLLKKIATTTELEDTPIKVLVRTRRHQAQYDEEGAITGYIDYDSENVDVYTCTLEYCGPRRPDGVAVYLNTMGQYLGPPTFAPSTVVIDAGNNIYWECKPGSTRLWADTALIWNTKLDSAGDGSNTGWLTPFAVDFTAVSASGTSDGVDVISWTVGDKRLGVNVNGQRVMLIDVTNSLIQFATFDMAQAPSGGCQAVPFWLKYADSVFMVYDPSSQRWAAAMSVDADGLVKSAVPLLPALTEAECL